MLFSLIIPTVKRTLELSRLLTSISRQKLTHLGLQDVEVIIVDQNLDERLLEVVEPFRKLLNIVRITAPSLGQSNAKNTGIEVLTGKYVTFPDDDCFYAEDTLEKAFLAFEESNDRCAIFGRCQDLDSKKYLLKYPRKKKMIFRPKDPSVFLGLQIAQFYTEDMVRAVGNFDVKFCSGGKWGSGEETDFAIRCLKKGFPIQFRPDILVCHPLVIPETMEKAKLKKYAIGFGALCRKHGLVSMLIWKTIKQWVGMVFFFCLGKWGKTHCCWIISIHRLEGYWQYSEE